MDHIIAYFHSLLHPEVVKRDFAQLRATGAGSILLALHEQEEQRFPRDFERGLQLAREAGLKVHLSLGRHGNIFAGPMLAPSWYTFNHPQSRVMDQHGRHHELTCFNHQSFRSWLNREVARLLNRYPLQGIVVEEPRGLEVTCYCAACRALCPDVTDLRRFRRRSWLEFLGELCAAVKKTGPDVKTTIVLHPQDISMAEDLVGLEKLDTLGCHLFWDMLREDVSSVEQWGRGILEVTHGTRVRSQLWWQNFNIDEQNEASMEEAFTMILGQEPDEIGCYYFWRNNVDPDRVWENTRRCLKRVPRRQLHWPMPGTPRYVGRSLILPALARGKSVAEASEPVEDVIKVVEESPVEESPVKEEQE
jgi:hypothetical protein